MSPPAVAVVIPTKDRARFLASAIRSVLAQDYPRLECIVVDGGSTDGTIDLLKACGDSLRWLSQPDAGPYEAIEHGWSLSTAEIVTWLNDDDLWLPGAVSQAVNAFAADPTADVVYGACLGINADGEIIWSEPARTWDLEKAIVAADHVINQPAAFIMRSAVERAGGLLHEWVHDHDLWLRIAVSGGRFLPIAPTLAAARIHDANFSMAPAFAHQQKLALVEHWLVDERTPPSIRAQRRRALSNAHLRGLHYLRPERPADWLTGLKFASLAIAASPANAGALLARIALLLARRLRRPKDLIRATAQYQPIIRDLLAPERSESGG